MSAKRWRRTWPDRTLRAFPLTQPPNRCQRCGVVEDGPLELDHMVEMADRGLDHPHNLVRLCSACHREKPLFSGLATDVEKRLAVLTWVAAGPRVVWPDPPLAGISLAAAWSEARRERRRIGAARYLWSIEDPVLRAFIELARSAIANDAAGQR